MNRPRKAFLLAAGFGMRMRPLTNTVVKPMMPLWGRPVIDHILDMLAGWGVRDVLVNLHHEPCSIVRHLAGRTRGPRIQFSFEPRILGTGGALVRAKWFLGHEPFWVINTDIAAALCPGELLREFHSRQPLAALWMHPDKGPRTVELLNGTVTNFRSTAPGADGTCTFCGLQILSPGIFDYLKGESFRTLIEVYEAAMKEGNVISGVTVPDSFWADLGAPDSYVRAHLDILKAYRTRSRGATLMRPRMLRRTTLARKNGVRIEGFAAIGEGAALHSGAIIENSVIWEGACIGARAQLNGSIVGCNTRTNSVSTGPVVRAGDYNRTPAFRKLLHTLGFTFDRTTVLPQPSRGSNRSFARLECGRQTAILIHYNLVRAENARFAGHARFLFDNGVPVPRILADIPGEQIVVTEDIGNRSLEDEAQRLSPGSLESRYRQVLDALLTLHGIPESLLKSKGVHLEPAFSPRVYEWERELMAKYFLNKSLGLPARTSRKIVKELEEIGKILHRQPRALVHRDMQSSNILIRNHKPVFIDFQGMRMGPVSYDLASLLCDPYVMLSTAMQNRLMEYYLDRCRDAEGVRISFWPAAVQRLTQALGAYGRLSAMPGTRRFEKYIPPALEMLSRALSHVDGLPALRKITGRSNMFSR